MDEAEHAETAKNCGRCGERPVGPGRMICPECRISLEQGVRKAANLDTADADATAT